MIVGLIYDILEKIGVVNSCKALRTVLEQSKISLNIVIIIIITCYSSASIPAEALGKLLVYSKTKETLAISPQNRWPANSHYCY